MLGVFNRKITAFLMACAVFITSLVSGSTTVYAYGDLTDVTINVTFGQTEARKMLDMINDLRSGVNAWYYDKDGEKVDVGPLFPLQYDYTLEKIAMQRALEIALSFDHERTIRERYYTAFDEIGYPSDSTAESIAAGQLSVGSVFTYWCETKEDYDGQEDRRNMLSEEFTAVGVGHVYYNKTHYWVQEFGAAMNVDGEKTEANDRRENYTLKVALAKIDSLNPSVSSIEMEKGAIKDLSGLTFTLSVDDYYNVNKNYVCPVITDFYLESTDYDVLKIDNKKIKAVAEGYVDLVVCAMGLEAEIPVKITKGEEYTVTLDACGGTCKTDTVTTKDKMVSTLPKPVKDGYEFVGWYISEKENSERITTSRVFTSDLTIYAHWKSDGSSQDPGASDDEGGDTDTEQVFVPDVKDLKVASDKKGELSITWTDSDKAKGYQVAYSTSGQFASSKTKMVNAGGSSKRIKKLKAGKKYYVRVRAFVKTSDGTLYGAWSKKTSVKIKK